MDAIRAVLNEPRQPNCPPRSRWDYVQAALLLVIGLLAAIFSDAVGLRPLAIAVAVVLPLLLIWRRPNPLAMIQIGFVVASGALVAALVADETTPLVGTTVPIAVILTFCLFRWASGREALVGLSLVLIVDQLNNVVLDVPAWERAVGVIPWMFVGAVAVVFRYRSDLRTQALNEARLAERQQLARELHDTVAHHVSAIAIQAQAGQAMGASDPDAGLEVLKTIEEAASRSLVDMRRMVGVLRDPDAGVEMAPQSGLADVAELATHRPGRPAVDVELSGRLDDLSPTVEASMYRLAQEAITNAQRHAKHATRISVDIVGDDDAVHLTVTDDGDPPPAVRSAGFGLVGMTERALLLGGTFEAGPAPGRGWKVTASVPKSGATR